MTKILEFEDVEFYLKRYPKTTNTSLRAWSNAEILALEQLKDYLPAKVHLFNDRFGVWNCLLANYNTATIVSYASQKKAITQNLKLNNLSTQVNYQTPLDDLQRVDLALVKVPKSLELFELFLQQIHKASTDKIVVFGAFLTKYFTSSYLTIASQYFEEVRQTKAWKKARLVVLKKPKKNVKVKSKLTEISYKKIILKQYLGVFSAKKIDIGTQFLLDNFELKPNELEVLDLACGNGVIARKLVDVNRNIQVSLVDDFNLAIESSKINLEGFNASFFCNDTLENLHSDMFDLVISNPPFHFEYENNIEVSLRLFEEVKRVLKNTGRFVLVANIHLNYKVHLSKIFFKVLEVSKNKKFVIYECYMF